MTHILCFLFPFLLSVDLEVKYKVYFEILKKYFFCFSSQAAEDKCGEQVDVSSLLDQILPQFFSGSAAGRVGDGRTGGAGSWR